jgi:hypothetical protein
VYVDSSGTFTKDSPSGTGVIYGANAPAGLRNTAYSGHAVYIDTSTKIRNSTAGSGVKLDSGQSGPAGGWE